MRGSVMLCALFLGVTAGCAQQNIPTPLHSQNAREAHGAGVSYKSLYSFTGQDGARPINNRSAAIQPYYSNASDMSEPLGAAISTK
jgi:hypothetical protein